MNEYLQPKDMDIIRQHVYSNTSFVIHTPTQEIANALIDLLGHLKIYYERGKKHYGNYRQDTAYYVASDGYIGFSSLDFFEEDEFYKTQPILKLPNLKE